MPDIKSYTTDCLQDLQNRVKFLNGKKAVHTMITLLDLNIVFEHIDDLQKELDLKDEIIFELEKRLRKGKKD